ncbi:hypothetical protein CYMTET_3960 [Cymbomonas tetramitiformis]|uniref:Uncharacterized protein n=1 Tax=Cymbomonas tetramitiformis TaxID=36881 RepID=A0AAE0H243_9CHLO|nr:hypothetical protein CYMTET_3960 [Cymbomonas tetramitiformis]
MLAAFATKRLEEPRPHSEKGRTCFILVFIFVFLLSYVTHLLPQQLPRAGPTFQFRNKKRSTLLHLHEFDLEKVLITNETDLADGIRVIVAKGVCGFGNHLNALASAAAFAFLSGRKLIVSAFFFREAFLPPEGFWWGPNETVIERYNTSLLASSRAIDCPYPCTTLGDTAATTVSVLISETEAIFTVACSSHLFQTLADNFLISEELRGQLFNRVLAHLTRRPVEGLVKLQQSWLPVDFASFKEQNVLGVHVRTGDTAFGVEDAAG